MLSGAHLRKLGSRLRNGNQREADAGSLDQLRVELDSVFVNTAIETAGCLTGIPAVIAGRAKRTQSIIRKLRRPDNFGMDLSRMEDLVGLRIVVPSQAEQQQVLERLDARLPRRRLHDYRSYDREYRAVHFVADNGGRFVEIQIRTIPQQLWANESESFGEVVKEGGGSPAIREYLRELASICSRLDRGGSVAEAPQASALLGTRQTLSVRLPALYALHADASKRATVSPNNAYVVVFDGVLNRATQVFEYCQNERERALEDYVRLSRDLDEGRYEVLILNASNEHLVQITHGRFFAEGLPRHLIGSPS
jgi:ppGpp synthetase/RelA/SpoT-type nucleotidyltranferase